MSTAFTPLSDIDVQGKTVLLRADLNVPVKDNESGGKIVADTTRIDRVKPTIDVLRGRGATVVVLAHFGRPKGEPDPAFSMEFLPPVLQQQWGCPVTFSAQCIGPDAQEAVKALADGCVLLMENLRFHDGEKNNDPAFVNALAELGDVYVNDAFSVSHRAHASVEGLAHALPAAAGLLMEQELSALQAALVAPEKPVMAITGGSKISTKLSVLKNLSARTDYLVLGGGMANTFLYACGYPVGESLCEKDMKDEALSILDFARENGCTLVLPKDVICVEKLEADAPFEIHDVEKTPDHLMAVDIGPQSIVHIKTLMQQCKTLVWNGPMGVFEIPPFDRGTNALAEHAGLLTEGGNLKSVAGGGDTVAALENAGVAGKFSYISTAGGAFLEWLEGKPLPGVEALSSSDKAA